MGVRFDPTDPEFLRDPYPTYAALREEPVSGHGFSLGDLYPISRYADCVRVLRNPSVFSSTAMILPGQEAEDTSLIGQDPPIHTGLRNIVNRGFTPRRIADLEAGIGARVEALVDALSGRDEIELIRDLAAPLPVMVIAELLGLDPDQHARFKRWADDMIVGSSGRGDAEADVDRSVAELRSFLEGAIEERRRRPGDDLVSVLIHAEEDAGVLTAREVLNFVQLLLAAGSETTTNLLGSAIFHGLRHPTQWAEVRRSPALVPALLEETLRFDSPVQLVMRLVTEDAEIGAAEVPAGERVFVLLGSANRDPAQFPDPDRFDIHRSTTGHLGFGLGTHFCLGASLARLQARLAVEALLAGLPGLALVGESVEHHGSFLVRGPRSLPLRVGG
ncbi:MAG: cytochrome P450 [Myxococcota bacterium]